jgi:DNA-binding NtrC family response regulator
MSRTSHLNEVSPDQPCPLTILLIEDEPQVRETTRAALTGMGHRVYAAESDCQARWLWQHHRHEINFLMTDMMIPRQATGTELASEFLAEKPELGVLVTSGFGPEIHEEDPNYPAHAVFLQKPFTSGALRIHLAKAISRIPSVCLAANI